MNGDIKPNTEGLLSQFKLDDHQSVIYERLKQLVGPGPAAFYKDACRHLDTRPLFAATTHIVSHLLREIESALRDVLESLTGPIKSPNGNNEENHKNEIRAILGALGIKESEPVAQGWLRIAGKTGFQSRTHRNNLEEARPIDDEFIDLFSQFESILSAVLDEFESQYTQVFETIDRLVKKNPPAKEDVETLLLHIPNNFLSRSRFFDQLADPAWLPLLEKENVLDEVPPPEYNTEERTTRYLPWPPANYLSKIAVIAAEFVAAVICEIKDNDNAFAKANLLTIAANLPLKNRLTVIERAKEWIEAKPCLYTADPAKKLIEVFADDGQIDPALELARILLEILPGPKSKTASAGDTNGLLRHSETRLDEWQYGEFLKHDFQRLVELSPQKAHEFVAQLLLDFVNLNYGHYPNHRFEDAMHVSRPSIGGHEDHRDYDRI